MSIILTVHGESQHPYESLTEELWTFFRSASNNFVLKYVRSHKMSLIDPKNKTKQKGNQLPMRIQNSRPSGRGKYTSFPLGQKVLRDKSLRWVNRLLKFRMPELGDIIQNIFCVENTSPCKVM